MHSTVDSTDLWANDNDSDGSENFTLPFCGPIWANLFLYPNKNAE